MEIHEISKEECLRVLARARLARLACARGNQPYIVPVYVVYHEASDCLYGFTTPGQKVEWMRANPMVCVEVDEIAESDQWISVIAFGHYEELPATQESKSGSLRNIEHLHRVSEAMPIWSDVSQPSQRLSDRERAWQLLKTDPVWGEPASSAWAARVHRDPTDPFIPIYYRIRIDRITGHEATRDAFETNSYAVPENPTGRCGWLRKTLARAFGGGSSRLDR